MVITSHSIEIGRPAAEVWEFLMEPQNYLKWQAGLVEVSATNGLNKGSQITFTSMGLGRRFELMAEVIENNARDHFEVISTRGPLTFNVKYQLESISPKSTRLALQNDIRTGGIFNLARPALQAMGENRYQADLEQLKIILENPAA